MIKGLSDQRWLPRLGHLRLGIKKKTAQDVEYPAEIDYFILDPQTPDAKRNEDLKSQFKKLYGVEPKSIKIMFPPAKPELFFAQWYKRYGKSTLKKCIGDGETATCATEEFAQGLEVIGKNDFGQPVVKCAGLHCVHQTKAKADCRRLASLQVLLPDLTGIGVWQINTSSSNSIRNINSAIEWLQGICGRFYMLPLTLMRVKTDIEYEGKRSVHYCLQIDQKDVKLEKLQLMAQTPGDKILLPPPDQAKDQLFYADAEDAKTEDKVEPETQPGPAKAKEPAKEPAAEKKSKATTQETAGAFDFNELDRTTQEKAVREMTAKVAKKRGLSPENYGNQLKNRFRFQKISELSDAKLKGIYEILSVELEDDK